MLSLTLIVASIFNAHSFYTNVWLCCWCILRKCPQLMQTICYTFAILHPSEERISPTALSSCRSIIFCYGCCCCWYFFTFPSSRVLQTSNITYDCFCYCLCICKPLHPIGYLHSVHVPWMVRCMDRRWLGVPHINHRHDRISLCSFFSFNFSWKPTQSLTSLKQFLFSFIPLMLLDFIVALTLVACLLQNVYCTA